MYSLKTKYSGMPIEMLKGNVTPKLAAIDVDGFASGTAIRTAAGAAM